MGKLKKIQENLNSYLNNVKKGKILDINVEITFFIMMKGLLDDLKVE